MRDIGRRIQRYRLSRYAREDERRLHIPRWVWAVLAAWLVWAGVLSDHSFFALWRLHRTYDREQSQLRTARAEITRLDAAAKDAGERRKDAERRLREDEGYARPGEIIFRIDGADSTKAR